MSTVPFRSVPSSAIPFLLLAASCRSDYRSAPLDEGLVLQRLDTPVVTPLEPRSEPAVSLSLDRPAAADAAELPLTLAQTQMLAIARHPSLRRMRGDRGLADAADVRVDVHPDPELSVSSFWIVPEAVLGGIASLRWELLAAGTRDARRGLACSMRDAIDARIADREWQIAHEARVAWLEASAAERELGLSERRADVGLQSREFAARMLERGATTLVLTSAIELESAEADRDLAASRASLRSARLRLAEVAGLPSGIVIRPRSDPDPLEPLEPRVPAGDADAALLARLPALRGARAGYLVAERELEIAHLGGLPRVAVGPDLERDVDSTKIGGGASITLPIHDGNRGAVAEARARRDIAAREFEEELALARARLARAAAEEDGATRALSIHELRVASAARQALAAAERAVEAGTSDLLALLVARERSMRAEQAGVLLRAAHAVAVARLEAAYGPEPEPVETASTSSRTESNR